MISLIIFAVTILGFSGLLVFLIWRIKKIESQLGVPVPFWQSIQSKLIVDLTHPHPAAERVDELLQLLQANPTVEMTAEDRQALLDGLAKRAAGDDPLIGEEERRKAAIFPLVMEEVQKEAANPNPIESVQVIGIKKEDGQA